MIADKPFRAGCGLLKWPAPRDFFKPGEVAFQSLKPGDLTIEITSVSLIKALVLNGKITIINREI